MHASVPIVLFVTCLITLIFGMHAQFELNNMTNAYFIDIHNGNSVAINDSFQHNLHTLLNRTLTSHLNEYTTHPAKSNCTSALQQLNTILNLTANQDDDQLIKIELSYLQFFDQLNSCPDLELYRWPSILHWIHTKCSALQTTNLITHDHSMNLMDTILFGLKYDSAMNAIKIRILWYKFFLPSIISIISQPRRADVMCSNACLKYQAAVVYGDDLCKSHHLLNSYLHLFKPDTAADNSIAKDREKQFLLAFDQFLHMFPNWFVKSTKHHHWIMQFNFTCCRTKRKYFDRWFYLDSASRQCVFVQDDHPKYAVFNTFVFGCFVGQNRTNVGQSRLGQIIQYFKDAVWKSTLYGGDFKKYFYNAYTVHRVFELVYNTEHYKEICDICIKFDLDYVFRTHGLEDIYDEWMARYKRVNIIDIDT
eukprot:180725_1